MTWQVGPTVLTCHADWSLTWHANYTCCRHAYIMMTSPWACYCVCWRHNYVMLTSYIFGSATWVGSAHPGEEDSWGASARMANLPFGAWRRVWTFPTSEFDAVFTRGFVSSSSTQWYDQNIILTTFIFEQKSNTTLNQMIRYQLLGKSDRWCFDNCSKDGKHTDTIFYVVRQVAYIHGRCPFY
jgi:hypothetical protein